MMKQRQLQAEVEGERERKFKENVDEFMKNAEEGKEDHGGEGREASRSDEGLRGRIYDYSLSVY